MYKHYRKRPFAVIKQKSFISGLITGFVISLILTTVLFMIGAQLEEGGVSKGGERADTPVNARPILTAIWEGRHKEAQRSLEAQQARGHALTNGARVLVTSLIPAMAAQKAGDWVLAKSHYTQARCATIPFTQEVKDHVEILFWLNFAMLHHARKDHRNAIGNLRLAQPDHLSGITTFEKDFYLRVAETVMASAAKDFRRRVAETIMAFAPKSSGPEISTNRSDEKISAKGMDAGPAAVRTDGNKSGKKRPLPAMEPEMVTVPQGRFRMGNIQGGGYRDELPVHEVLFPNAFAIGRHEVTNQEYVTFLNDRNPRDREARRWIKTKPENPAGQIEKLADGYRAETDYARHPVMSVSWFGAVAYAKWLSEKTGRRFRLPTEAEWEYAARAGTDTRYWWGNDIGQNRANCDGCGGPWERKGPAPVGSFAANAFGLHDVHGNVWEWVQDCGTNDYSSVSVDGSAMEVEKCKSRILRGGGWSFKPWYARSSVRFRFLPVSRNPAVGFRLARDL